VQFDPTVSGAATGQLVIASNSSAGSMVVSLNGTGMAYAIDLSWDPPSGSGDPVAGYRVYRAASGSSSYQLLTAAIDAETSYTDSAIQAGASYQYYVTTVDDSGVESAASNTADATVP
jgi:fibronectin type 3 domain-containing protein